MTWNFMDGSSDSTSNFLKMANFPHEDDFNAL